MLELWGKWSTPLSPSPPGSLWPRVVAPDKRPLSPSPSVTLSLCLSLSPYIYIYIYIYVCVCVCILSYTVNFGTNSNWLFFHWSLSNNKFHWISRTLLSILDDLI